MNISITTTVELINEEIDSPRLINSGSHWDYMFHDITVCKTFHIDGEDINACYRTGIEFNNNDYSQPSNKFCLDLEQSDEKVLEATQGWHTHLSYELKRHLPTLADFDLSSEVETN
jgi:hypothetical protein